MVERWKVFLISGIVEEVTGQLRVVDGVLQITYRNPSYNIIHSQVSYPLTSVLKWEWVRR